MAQSRETRLAKMRARSARLRLADVEAYRAKQRERYAANRDAIRAFNAASYQRHRKARLAHEKAMREADPERAAMLAAKRQMARDFGIKQRDIPDEIAEMKALELAIKRVAKAQLSSDNMPSR